MQIESDSQLNDLKLYLRPLLRWWWLLILAAALAAGSAAYFLGGQQPVYHSTGTLMVGTFMDDPNPDSQEFGLAAQLAASYTEIARRSSIRQAVQNELGLEFLPDYSVRVVPYAQLIELTVIDTDPRRAQRVAQEIINQLIQQTPAGRTEQGRQAFMEQQLNLLESGIQDTVQEIERLEAELTTLFSARQIADVRNQISALDSKLGTLQTNYANIFAISQRGAINTIAIMEEPNLPQYPIQQNNRGLILIALFLGFVMAATGAYILEYLDDTIRSEADVYVLLKSPIVALLPKAADKKHSGFDAGKPRPPYIDDAYAAARLHLSLALKDRRTPVLLVAGMSPADNAPEFVSNLGLTYARAGQRALLIDGDLRRPTLHRLFKLSNHNGLSKVLMEGELERDPTFDVSSIVHKTNVPGLMLLPAGPLPANPATLLNSMQMSDLLRKLRPLFDLVVIVSPPVHATIDSLILAEMSDACILTVAAGKSRAFQLRRALAELKKTKVEILGIALSEVSLSQYPYPVEYGIAGLSETDSNRERISPEPQATSSATRLNTPSNAPPNAPPNAASNTATNGHRLGYEEEQGQPGPPKRATGLHSALMGRKGR